MYTWGWNGYGQLGTDSNLQSYGLPQQRPSDFNQLNHPVPIKNVDDHIFVTASAGMFHTVALTDDGENIAENFFVRFIFPKQ